MIVFEKKNIQATQKMCELCDQQMSSHFKSKMLGNHYIQGGSSSENREIAQTFM